MYIWIFCIFNRRELIKIFNSSVVNSNVYSSIRISKKCWMIYRNCNALCWRNISKTAYIVIICCSFTCSIKIGSIPKREKNKFSIYTVCRVWWTILGYTIWKVERKSFPSISTMRSRCVNLRIWCPTCSWF